MIQVLLSSMLLSMIYATIPNHWMPRVAIGHSERWNTREPLAATGITSWVLIFIGTVTLLGNI